ncbi:hypothetical protein J6590_075608 [Homalodisca vitripennis]|nr:hypothetical protein J6590_075608 [Homalodisca vitripennis]
MGVVGRPPHRCACAHYTEPSSCQVTSCRRFITIHFPYNNQPTLRAYAKRGVLVGSGRFCIDYRTSIYRYALVPHSPNLYRHLIV